MADCHVVKAMLFGNTFSMLHLLIAPEVIFVLIVPDKAQTSFPPFSFFFKNNAEILGQLCCTA